MPFAPKKPDLVLFAGPVIFKEEFSAIPWERPTEVVEVRAPQDVSSSYRELGRQGLAEIVQRFTGKSPADFDQIALTAWSKGGSLVDEVLRNSGDRSRVGAVVLNDALFGSEHTGTHAFLEEAARGEKLLVVTNTNNRASASLPKRARESVEEMIGPQIGEALIAVPPAGEMPRPSGGVWNVGDFFWYDYVQPNGQNDISHAEHHDLAPTTWEAHLVPYFAGSKLPTLLAFAGATALIGTAIWVSRK